MEYVKQRSKKNMEWHKSMDLKCPECGSDKINNDTKTGDSICCKCGLVISEKSIDHGKEWRAFTHEERNKRARTGMPTSQMYPDKGLTTVIGNMKGGSPEQKRKMRRLKKTNYRNIGTNPERNFRKAFRDLRIICNRLKIKDNPKQDAVKIYRKSVNKKMSQGRPMDALLCACLYIACKINSAPIPLESFYRFAKPNQIKNCISMLVFEDINIKNKLTSPNDCLHRIASQGNICEYALIKAYKIINKMENLKLIPSRDPRGYAAAALYIACKATKSKKRKRSQKDMALYADITEVTVRKCIDDIQDKLILKIK